MSKNSSHKKQASPKPRGEQLLDRLDKNPNDREAWNELSRTSKGKPSKRATKRATKTSSR